MFRLMNPGIEYSESVNQFGLYLFGLYFCQGLEIASQ